jgi:hypothetical protein
MDFEIYTDADIEESLWEDEVTFDEYGQGKMKI